MNGWVMIADGLPPPSKRCVIVTIDGAYEVAWLQYGEYFRTDFGGYEARRIARWFLIPDFE